MAVSARRRGVSGRAWLLGLWAGAVVICCVAVGCGGSSRPAVSAAVLAGPGRTLFEAVCGRCHTLGAAGAHGEVGPDLDHLKPSLETVLAAIRSGGGGSGIMPKNLYTGEKAREVAEFVSEAAGR